MTENNDFNNSENDSTNSGNKKKFKHNCKYRESFYVHQGDRWAYWCHNPKFKYIPLQKRCVEKDCNDWELKE